MKNFLYTLSLCATTLVVSQASNAGTPIKMVKQLETISESIGNHTDMHALSDSLYRQLRPHVEVKNTKLKASQVDRKVRSYITKKFVPILVMNYSLQYSKMKKAGLHFGGCKTLHALRFDENTDMALCASKSLTSLDVHYMTREAKAHWKTTSIYEFQNEKNQLMLTGVHLSMKKDQKIRISGL